MLSCDANTSIVLRRYKPTDHAQICVLFRQGMEAMFPAVWRSTVRAPAIFLPIAFSTTVLTTLTRVVATKKLSATLAVAALTTVLPLAAIWIKISEGFGKYITDCLEKDDLSSPEKLQEVYGGKGAFIVALQGDKLIGMVGGQDQAKKETPGIFELRRMSVQREVQRSGVARLLVQKLEEELGSSKKKIFLTCSSAQYAARRMYSKCGFECLKEFQFGSWFTKQGVSFFRFEKEYGSSS